jgi:hypothetical protein
LSFLYPRVIAITRPVTTSQAGIRPYSGVVAANETAVSSGIQCSIQYSRAGGQPATRLPGDAQQRSMWRVLIPLAALANGVINEHDIVTDDLGVRYQVTAPYWNSLGYNLLVERLDT